VPPLAFLSHRSLCRVGLLCTILAAGSLSTAQAQVTRGFDRTAPAKMVNEEQVRQPDLWMMEVQFKPMRMVWIDGVNPQTGQATREQIWYLPWRAIRRPLVGREVPDVAPVNQLDPLPGPMQFIPQLTLVTYDNPQSEVPSQILPDVILPSAMEQIRRIERANILNSVDVVQNLPEATPVDAEEQNWIYGAATWRGVDPETDFFKVIFSGFSNGYEAKTADDGAKQIWRKVILQRYARPGDRYDPNQREFQFVGQPEWAFQPDPQRP
jgi:hypothetical protein